MTMQIGSNVHLVDLCERGTAGRTCGMLLTTPRPTIVEPGSANSLQVWLDRLEEANLPRDEVAYIVVTHVHLDHGGGAGALAEVLPNARVVVHPRGARHLANPERLINGARAIFGDKLESYWGTVTPVPEQKLLVPEADEQLDLGGGHRLRFLDAPGHAKHQYAVLEEGSGCLYAADELGVRYPSINLEHGDYVLPTTTPNQFDPDAMIASAARFTAMRPETIVMSHFGVSRDEPEALKERLTAQVRAFVAAGEQDGRPLPPEQIKERLLAHLQADIAAYGLTWNDAIAATLEFDTELSALGIADYYQRSRNLK